MDVPTRVPRPNSLILVGYGGGRHFVYGELDIYDPCHQLFVLRQTRPVACSCHEACEYLFRAKLEQRPFGTRAVKEGLSVSLLLSPAGKAKATALRLGTLIYVDRNSECTSGDRSVLAGWLGQLEEILGAPISGAAMRRMEWGYPP